MKLLLRICSRSTASLPFAIGRCSKSSFTLSKLRFLRSVRPQLTAIRDDLEQILRKFGVVLLLALTCNAWAESMLMMDHQQGHHQQDQAKPKNVKQVDGSHHHALPMAKNARPINQDVPISPHKHNFSHLPKPAMGHHDYFGSVIVDRLEMVNSRNDFSMTYDWQAWFGGDYHKALLRAEGEIDNGSFKNARNELLWAYALTPYWDSQLGVRYDSGLGTDRTWGAFGLQGYLPYWLYMEATAYIGEDARTAFRLELEYDLLITQKLILQPRIELNFYSRRDPTRLVSSGLSNIEAGLRLRYEFRREFAPYLGIEWASTLGSAADNIKTQGGYAEEARFIAGIHFWF